MTMNIPSPSDLGGATDEALRAQDLATGALGECLLRIERAQRGNGPWQPAHTALTACTRHDLIADDNAALYLGAPAVAFALHIATGGTGRYGGALRQLDARITALTRRRLELAHQRIDRGERPHLGEFDLFYGLTGLGTYWLCRQPDSEVLHDVLTYLVRLTRPLADDEEQLPGWWSPLDPSGATSEEFLGGHGNAGMAHGIAGPLSLLALAQRHGTTVEGQTEAMERVCAWLDHWRQDTEVGAWWPYWITLDEHRAGTVFHSAPPRPSWCYGIPGLARAQQLAGLALDDSARQRRAEHALLCCLADPAQLARIRDAGLCHGAAGLLHTTHRVAHDAESGALANHLPRLRALLHSFQPPQSEGLLEGTTGVALALLAAEADGTTTSGWDACLLAG